MTKVLDIKFGWKQNIRVWLRMVWIRGEIEIDRGVWQHSLKECVVVIYPHQFLVYYNVVNYVMD